MTKSIKKSEKAFFALADFYGGGGQALISVLYLVFLTDFIKLDIEEDASFLRKALYTLGYEISYTKKEEVAFTATSSSIQLSLYT